MNAEVLIQKTQVVIIGAGPTGLSMAVQLLRYHIDFIILEKNAQTTPFSKALVVQARTLEIFEEINLAEKAIAEGSLTTALNVFEKGKQKLRVDLSGLGDGISPFPFALSLEQCKTEELLLHHLTENGKQVCWSSTFNHFTENEDGVTVYYKDNEGKEKTIEAKYLVGADGASSLLRHQLGCTFEGDTVPKLFYVSDTRIKSNIICENKLYMFLIEKGFILFFPMQGEGNYRVIGILPNAKEDHHFNFEELIPDLKEQIALPVEIIETRWFSTYKVHSRKANYFRKGRCFIAGDAAHIHTPAGGQGMNTGIQDAYNLAWKIALMLEGKLNDTVLESYNTEREENARNLLNSTDRIFDMMAGTNFFWNFIRLKILPLVANFVTQNSRLKKKVFPLVSQTAITYQKSSLTIKSKIANVEAGVRMPYFVFENGKAIFQFLKEPCFKLIFFGDEDKANFQNFKNRSLNVSKLLFTEIPSSIFKNNRNFYILLRPDNHISYIGKDISICNTLFKKILI
jgi:2-polyprenyl-6-methoxyphenol hydroxylase-like FAD-dependent oxidoreductase